MANYLQRFDIAASTGYPDVARKVAIIGRNEDYVGQRVTLLTKVEHYDAEGKRLNAFAPLEINPILLVADNTSYVNPETGALVFADAVTGQYEQGSVGQYDWLKSAVEAGANPFDIASGAVLEAVSLGRFD